MNQKYVTVVSIILTIFIFSCKNQSEKKDISKVDKQLSPGLIYTTANDLDEAVENFKSFVEIDETLVISTEIDHVQNAKSAGLELKNNKVLFINNPRYSSPLINENPLMALEFPIRIGFYEADGKKYVVSRSEDYFIKRYGLTNSAALRSVGSLTETLLKQSTDSEFVQVSPIDSLDSNGIRSMESSKTFDETITAIQSLIEADKDLTLFESRNFSEAAKDIGVELKPTHILIFGNPKAGTKLMQKNPNFSIDLPLKILVEQSEDDRVTVHFQDISYTSELHSEEFEDNLPEKITENLEEILSKAVSVETSSK